MGGETTTWLAASDKVTHWLNLSSKRLGTNRVEKLGVLRKLSRAGGVVSLGPPVGCP